MDALSLLLNRHSQPRLENPAPSGVELENIIQSGLKAPDHAGLKPWHFVVCQHGGLDKLGNLFQQSAIDNNKPQKDIERAAQLPHRAPMVIVAIMRYTAHDKVPHVEQIASASCAVMAMQMAALAQGFNGIWRTGSYARCQTVKKGFDLKDSDEIVGFLYLGTPKFDKPKAPSTDASTFVTYWQ